MDPASEAALAPALAFLEGLAVARRRHSGADLAAHLVGTQALLHSWGARGPLCRAGLFHSVFGTEMFPVELPPDTLRAEVRDMIGAEAERLAWLFGQIDRESFTRQVTGAGPCLSRSSGEPLDLSALDLADLANLYTANAVEQLPRFPEICAVVERALIAPCDALLLPAARTALAAVRSEE